MADALAATEPVRARPVGKNATSQLMSPVTLRTLAPRGMLASMRRSARSFQPSGTGPFRVEYLRPGDPYELSDGHAIVREPAGPRRARRNLTGAAVIDSDPAVEVAAVDAGYVLGEATLRAPDVSVGGLDDGPGFASGAPALAIEYGERDGDEADLERKIAQLLGAGTAIVRVVRLGGEERVEVHRRGEPVAVKRRGEDLLAPGILRNPVPLEALYDRTVAHEVTLRNLLQRRGYASLEDVRRDAALEHARLRLRRTLELRRIAVSAEQERYIESCADLAELDLWLDRALVAATAEAVFRARAGRRRRQP